MTISRDRVSAACVLFPPATSAAIAQAEEEFGRPLPPAYLDLVRMSNGLHTRGDLSLLDVEGVLARNSDYQVQEYLPEYFMIGDDGGGIALLLNLRDERVYEVEMGVMSEESMRLSAVSIEQLLVWGTTLGERGGW